jgi:hypothetical protein
MTKNTSNTMRAFVLLAITVLVIPLLCCGGGYVFLLVSPSIGGLLPVYGPSAPSFTRADYPDVQFSSRNKGDSYQFITISPAGCGSGNYECEMGDLPRFNLSTAENQRQNIETRAFCERRVDGWVCEYGNCYFQFSEAGVKVHSWERRISDKASQPIKLYFRGERIELPIAKARMKELWGEPTKVYETD